MKIHTVFLNCFTWMDAIDHFAKYGGEIMLWVLNAQEPYTEARIGGKYWYWLLVRGDSEAESAISRIEWSASRHIEENVRADVGDFGHCEMVELGRVIKYWLENLSLREIRHKLEQALPGVEFENWDDTLGRMRSN